MVHSILYDAILFIIGIYMIETFILKKGLSEKESFIVDHSYTWIRVGIVTVMDLLILYMIGSDLGLIDGKLYHMAIYGNFLIFYIVCIILLYDRYRYGPKDWQYMEATKLGIEAVIGMTILFLLMYAFD